MSTGEKIFWSFIIIFLSVLFAFLPVTDAAYAFKTDTKTDTFSVSTGAGETTGNVTLFKTVYDDDTSTIELLSQGAGDEPIWTSYNTTTRALIITGLSENLTRSLSVTYDTTAAGTTGAIATIIDNFSTPIYILLVVLFPIAGFLALFLFSRGN